MDANEIVKKLEKVSNIQEELAKLHKENRATAEDISEARKKLIQIVKDRSIVKLNKADSADAKYNIVYDSIGRGLEPFYFWVLDFMRNPAIGMEVNKIYEEFEATTGGGYFGELGQKASVMQDRAIALMERTNAVVRSIVNLVYDLKDFELRTELYDKASKSNPNEEERRASEYALKGIWMDQVDIKEGRGSINSLTSGDLQFVTLRDAFMQVKSLSDIGDIDRPGDGMDLNRRVKIILKQKYQKYLLWREKSEIELKKRYNIERNYLKAQVDSLKIYTKWARPYLRAAQKLKMNEFKTKAGLPAPEMVTTFNNMMMELSLFGKKEVKPQAVHKSYEKMKFPTKIYSCIEVFFKFRTLPQTMQGERGSHFVQTGVVDITFVPYVLTEEDVSLIESGEVYEDLELVENLTGGSLKELEADIEKYLLVKKPETREEKKEGLLTGMFGNPFKGLKEVGENLGLSKDFYAKMISKAPGKYELDEVKNEAKEVALDKCLTLYKVFKKAHRMTQW